jgi:RNA polymerase sigma-70 factor (ECF subfamily)
MQEAELRSQLEEHHPEAYGWALYCCSHDTKEAEDVLQTAYLKILNGKARFNANSTFRTWLFGVIRNTAADQRRSWWRRLLRESGWAAERPAAGLQRDSAEDEGSAPLRNAMTELSERQQEVLHLTFYQEMTIEEAARVMEISVGSARTHYERGKARLRHLLNGVLR